MSAPSARSVLDRRQSGHAQRHRGRAARMTKCHKNRHCCTLRVRYLLYFALCQCVTAIGSSVMDRLHEAMNRQLDATPSTFRRYIYPLIKWENRMLCLVGPRGVGKTTLFLQDDCTPENRRRWHGRTGQGGKGVSRQHQHPLQPLRAKPRYWNCSRNVLFQPNEG